MDDSTREALRAIITGIAAAEAVGGSMVAEIANSLAMYASLSKEAGDPVTAADLASLSRWANTQG